MSPLPSSQRDSGQRDLRGVLRNDGYQEQPIAIDGAVLLRGCGIGDVVERDARYRCVLPILGRRRVYPLPHGVRRDGFVRNGARADDVNDVFGGVVLRSTDPADDKSFTPSEPPPNRPT